MLIEAFIQDIKVQLHMTPEEISSSGSVASVKATVMSLSKCKLRFGYSRKNSKRISKCNRLDYNFRYICMYVF